MILPSGAIPRRTDGNVSLARRQIENRMEGAVQPERFIMLEFAVMGLCSEAHNKYVINEEKNLQHFHSSRFRFWLSSC